MAESMISPTNMVLSHNRIFCAGAQFSHCTSGQGHVTFYHTQGTNHTTYTLHMKKNGLWYHDAPAPNHYIILKTPEHQAQHPPLTWLLVTSMLNACLNCGTTDLSTAANRQCIKPTHI